ncbi:MAG: translation initiation factor IF-1 [Verrucomicrobiae bacterium]|nr:translation initiation factor IF-1 [Verrucomicrobiae bacterium]NNJ43084.1 translation initiation factor IF-1 [Akkermansiaceae bacterium]
MFDPPITTIGTVIDSPKPKIYHVSLPNGKVLIGHIPKALIHLHERIQPNTQVNLELTPFDFEKGRIVGVVEP